MLYREPFALQMVWQLFQREVAAQLVCCSRPTIETDSCLRLTYQGDFGTVIPGLREITCNGYNVLIPGNTMTIYELLCSPVKSACGEGLSSTYHLGCALSERSRFSVVGDPAFALHLRLEPT